jgi:hypothetical protein
MSDDHPFATQDDREFVTLKDGSRHEKSRTVRRPNPQTGVMEKFTDENEQIPDTECDNEFHLHGPRPLTTRVDAYITKKEGKTFCKECFDQNERNIWLQRWFSPLFSNREIY